MDMGAHRVQGDRREPSELAYLERDVVRNALDIWLLKRQDPRYTLHTWPAHSKAKAHLGIYNTPEAAYSSLGGEETGAEALVSMIPERTILTAPPSLLNLVESRIRNTKAYPNDIMLARRGREKLGDASKVVRLSEADAREYSGFGTSFNVANVPIEWARERLKDDFIFGAFVDKTLASVASLTAWLPQVAVILGVETKPEFRGRGLARAVVSAAVREGLRWSRSCSLFVRSDNEVAIGLYRSLGFEVYGSELWVDIGTGIVP